MQLSSYDGTAKHPDRLFLRELNRPVAGEARDGDLRDLRRDSIRGMSFKDVPTNFRTALARARRTPTVANIVAATEIGTLDANILLFSNGGPELLGLLRRHPLKDSLELRRTAYLLHPEMNSSSFQDLQPEPLKALRLRLMNRYPNDPAVWREVVQQHTSFYKESPKDVRLAAQWWQRYPKNSEFQIVPRDVAFYRFTIWGSQAFITKSRTDFATAEGYLRAYLPLATSPRHVGYARQRFENIRRALGLKPPKT